LEAVVAEENGKDLADALLVVDDQNSGNHGGLLNSRAG
jgi:hypothetical protein